MKTLACVAVISLFTCAAAWGQATAQMHGTVRDASGAVQTGNTQARWFSGLPVISIAGTVAAGGAGGSNLLGTEYTLDGALHLQILSGSTMPVAFPDAVQEFKVEAAGQTAQHGAS